MPEFHMDSDGQVNGLEFADLPPITRGYIEAMLFIDSSCISMVDWEKPESQHRITEGTADGCLPGDSGFGDIHPETLERIIADCGAFHVKARDYLLQVYEFYPHTYSAEQAGRDFWFTRNGHGVGFWDRGLGALGDRLTEIAKTFGGVDSYFSDPDPASPTGYGFVCLY